MGSNNFKELGINPQEKIGTDDFERLWNTYAHNKMHIDRKAALKFIKELSEVLNVPFDKAASKKIIDGIDPKSDKLDKTTFTKIFFAAATEFDGKKQKKGREARIQMTQSFKKKSTIQRAEPAAQPVIEKAVSTPSPSTKKPKQPKKPPTPSESSTSSSSSPKSSISESPKEVVPIKQPDPDYAEAAECSFKDKNSIECKVNVECNITVIIKDAKGKPFKQELNDLMVTASTKGEKIPVVVSANINGFIGLRFIPTASSAVILEVLIGERHISGSPLKLQVIENTGPTTFCCKGVIEIDQEGPPKFTNQFSNRLNIITEGTEIYPTSMINDYATTRANVKVMRGRWQYELVVKSGTKCRLGWATSVYVPSNNIALGNDESSWAYDIDTGKKFNNNTGTGYGDGPGRVNDVYGCFVDFQLRKIWFTRNDKYFGFAFSNIRVDGLLPVVSVSSNTRVIVNFGPNFKYPFIATHGLNPTVFPKEKKFLEKLWKKYQSSGDEEEGDPLAEVIANKAVLAVGADLGVNDPSQDPQLTLFAWKLSSRTQWNFHKDEFMTLMALQNIYSPEDLQRCSKKWLSEIENHDVYRSWYMFMFDYLKPGAQATVIAVDEALLAWRLIGIHRRWSVFSKWEEYLKGGTVKTINNDTWSMLLTLIEKVGSNPDKFDDSDCWASIIEDFVLDFWKK